MLSVYTSNVFTNGLGPLGLDSIYEVAKHCTSKDVLNLSLLNKITFSRLRSRVIHSRCMLELKSVYRYTPPGFIFKRHVLWRQIDTSRYIPHYSVFCWDVFTTDIVDFYKMQPLNYRSNLFWSINYYGRHRIKVDGLRSHPIFKYRDQ